MARMGFILSMIVLFCVSTSACCTKMPSSVTIPPPTVNPNARADAFKLFYRERAERTVLGLNRFAMAGDTVFASVFGKSMVAISGSEYEVVPGPNDNNPIGISVFGAWKGYQAMGGRDLELTLIRLFEGLVFNEQVSGHPGLTCREALPGWTLKLDGVSGQISRTRGDGAVTSPVNYSSDLEKEILDRFYNGVLFTYRNDPWEYYFKFKAVDEPEHFSTTFVFGDLPGYGFSSPPSFLRISDCCSSWMMTKSGPWKGAFWGNHNSRDNFPDYAMGYLAAVEAVNTPGLPADLAEAARRAAEAGRRTADAIVASGMVQMTVDEWHDYGTLVPAGQRRPDGSTESQDLGSFLTCQMAYMAKAISSEGLQYPVPEITLPAAMTTCRSIDDAFLGTSWCGLLKFAEWLSGVSPELLEKLTGGLRDDARELMLCAAGLCQYARITRQDDLYAEARNTLWNIIRLVRLLKDEEGIYLSAIYARMFDMEAPLEQLEGFRTGNEKVDRIESMLEINDTTPDSLLTDKEIQDCVTGYLADQKSWIKDRYQNRFGSTTPVRRSGEGYQCIGPDGRWMTTENPRHVKLGSIPFWREMFLCTVSPHTLDCSWARRGCAPADLDGSGVVDSSDMALFNSRWEHFGRDAACDNANGGCNGADLDGNGVLNDGDRNFMTAAQGCRR